MYAIHTFVSISLLLYFPQDCKKLIHTWTKLHIGKDVHEQI